MKWAMMSENLWKVIQAGAWTIMAVSLGLSTYYSNSVSNTGEIAKISERVAVIDFRSSETERKTNQELLGYQELLRGVGIQLGEMNTRLSHMEGRLETIGRKP